MDNIFGVDGLRVLITGGTGDIGSKLVGGFLNSGANVCAVARSEEAIISTRRVCFTLKRTQFRPLRSCV